MVAISDGGKARLNKCNSSSAPAYNAAPSTPTHGLVPNIMGESVARFFTKSAVRLASKRPSTYSLKHVPWRTQARWCHFISHIESTLVTSSRIGPTETSQTALSWESMPPQSQPSLEVIMSHAVRFESRAKWVICGGGKGVFNQQSTVKSFVP